MGGEGVKTASSVVLASSNHCNVILIPRTLLVFSSKEEERERGLNIP